MTTQPTPEVEKEDPLHPSERVALGTFLSDWDETLTFDEVLQQIQDEDDSDNAPSIWEPFENYPKDDVVRWIENLDDQCEDLNEPVRIAAPELLAALESCSKTLEGLHKLYRISNATPGVDNSIPEVSSVEALARAAIDKATTNS